jgi:homoserine O-acetyltransferase
VVAYETFGALSRYADNVIFVCHALTGDSHAARHNEDDLPGWWEPMIGPGRPIDTTRYFVVCANILGGCAGTTGPCSSSPDGTRFGDDFPPISVPDMVAAHRALLAYLGLSRPLLAVIGGSLGGMQTLEWLLRHPADAAGFFVIAGSAAQSAENLAWHAIGRAAIRSDPKFAGGDYPADDPPAAGQGLARMVAHMTYLSETALEQKFGRSSNGGRFTVASYLEHQADKLNARFDPNSYLSLTSAMDRFDAFTDPLAWPLLDDRAPAVHLFSFASDRLFGSQHSVHIQRTLAEYGIKATHYCETTSVAGHDAFLLQVPPYLTEVRHLLEELARERSIAQERP